MSNITLYNNIPDTTTDVPNIFIDNYMTKANGEYVKIYLYLLRCINRADCRFSIATIADHFDCTEKDVSRAFRYWEKYRLLKLEYDAQENLVGICLLTNQPDYIPENEPSDFRQDAAANGERYETAPYSETPVRAGSPSHEAAPAETVAFSAAPTADDMKDFCEREDIQELIFLAETYLGRTINQSDLSFIFSWYDQLHFSSELIEFLIENCIAKGHSSLHYMQKVAEDWAAQQVASIEDAKVLVSQNSETYYAVMKAFGIRGRNLVPMEMDLLKKWTTVFGFSKEMVIEACQRTITNIHEPSFEYTDRILSNWHAQCIQSLDAVKKSDAEYQKTKTANRIKLSGNTKTATSAKPNKFNNFQQREYDYDQLSKKLLEQSLQ